AGVERAVLARLGAQDCRARRVGCHDDGASQEDHRGPQSTESISGFVTTLADSHAATSEERRNTDTAHRPASSRRFESPEAVQITAAHGDRSLRTMAGSPRGRDSQLCDLRPPGGALPCHVVVTGVPTMRCEFEFEDARGDHTVGAVLATATRIVS